MVTLWIVDGIEEYFKDKNIYDFKEMHSTKNASP
jgi:hypothetical protein